MAYASLHQTSSPAEEFPLNLTSLQLSLGVDLVLLGPFSRAEQWLSTTARPLLAPGWAGLSSFLAYWFVYTMIGGAFFPPPGGLSATYLVWIVRLVALLPICMT